jgi:hypothetical protein
MAIDLSSCGTVKVWCNATITDSNGWNDVNMVNATFWDPAATSQEAADNNNTHYTSTQYTGACTLNGGSGSNVNANCSFTVLYHANPAAWECRIYANDTSSNVGNNSRTGITVNTLRALDANNTIGFGSLSPGATSVSDSDNIVLNCGNTALDLNLSGTDLTNATASVTNVSVSYVKYNVTDAAQSYADAMIALSTTPAYANFTLAKRTTVLSVDDTYWKIGIPASIENLVFTGTISFTAVPDT